MANQYKFGIYFATNYRLPEFGVGAVWDNEKYIHVNFLFWELTIGKTAK